MRWAKLELAQKALDYSNWNNRIVMEFFNLIAGQN